MFFPYWTLNSVEETMLMRDENINIKVITVEKKENIFMWCGYKQINNIASSFHISKYWDKQTFLSLKFAVPLMTK